MIRVTPLKTAQTGKTLNKATILPRNKNRVKTDPVFIRDIIIQRKQNVY